MNMILDQSGQPVKDRRSHLHSVGSFLRTHLPIEMSIVALLVSILSPILQYEQIQQGSRVALEAKALAIRRFYQVNRPLITVAPKQSEKTKQYVTLEMDDKQTVVNIVFMYDLINCGSAPAQALRPFGSNPVTVRLFNRTFHPPLDIPGDIIVAPAAQSPCVLSIAVTVAKGSANEADFNKFLQDLNKEAFVTTIQLDIDYENALAPSQKHKARFTHRIYRDAAFLIKSSIETTEGDVKE